MVNFPNNGVQVGDDAFPLIKNLLKPFSGNNISVKQKVFNYRLSRARRIAENVFGILTSRFRVFERPIALLPDTVDLVTKASCALHNWLRTTNITVYLPPGAVDTKDYNARNVIPASWRNNGHVQRMQDITFRLGSNNYSNDAASVRDSCADYFVNEGSVPWQLRMIGAE
jgi:hypothetical protein